jgi:hypothetical protein
MMMMTDIPYWQYDYCTTIVILNLRGEYLVSSEERRLDYLNVSGKEYVPYIPADKVIPEFTGFFIGRLLP